MSSSTIVQAARIVSVDRRYHAQRMIESAVRQCRGMRLAGQAAEVADGIALLERTQPHVALFHLEIAGGDYLAALEAMHRASPATRIVAWVRATDDQGQLLGSGLVERVIEEDLAADDIAGLLRTLLPGGLRRT